MGCLLGLEQRKEAEAGSRRRPPGRQRSTCAFQFPGLAWGWAGGRTDPWVLRTFPSPGTVPCLPSPFSQDSFSLCSGRRQERVWEGEKH